LQNLNNDIATQHPVQTLELLHTVLPDDVSGWPYPIEENLQTICDSDTVNKSDERLLELRRKWNAR
jgi:hypothetical protein